MAGHPRTNVRRSNVTACTRCKQRKQRCDQQIPACSNCERAGALCVSADPGGHTTSRRYLKELEDKVAALENQLMSAGSPQVTISTQYPPSSPGHGVRADDPSPGIDSPSMQGVLTHPDTLDPDRRGRPLRSFDVSIPSQSDCRILTDAYFEHSNFFSPFVDRRKLMRDARTLYGKDTNATLSDSKTAFTLCAVLAVSARLLHCTDPTYSITSAERYFAVALAAYEDQDGALHTGNLDELECLLLVVQYTMFASDLPTCLQYLQSAINLAMSLKLHTCTSNDKHDTSAEHRLRNETNGRSTRGQWLFWTTYNFERNLRSALQMPMAIADSAIETCLPQNYENDHMQALAIHILRYRQLESEIQTYRFSSLEIVDASHASVAFRSRLYARLVAWKDQCPPFLQPSSQVSLDIIEGLFEVAVVRLYSNASHLASLSKDETSLLLKHAAHGIIIYRKSFKEGSLRFYWRTIHNLYLCGSALVHCVKVSAANPDIMVDVGEATRLATVCSTVLWGMAERYPAGVRLRDTFDDLAETAFHAKSRDLLTVKNPGYSYKDGGAAFDNQPFDHNLANEMYDLDNFDETIYCS